MTALAGIWRHEGASDTREDCARILNAQKAYGLDGTAQWSGEGVAFGRNLMRLLPEDRFDCGPVIGGGGKLVLVADVRIDNRAELIVKLGLSAERAKTSSDSALLMAAIEHWCGDVFDHLLGDYAFALWNAAEQSLLLARDPLGLRPLHFHRGKDFVAFATMPKGLHALPQIAYAPDEERIAEFLLGIPETGSESFFSGIERVPPGHAAILSRDGLTLRRHWNPKRRSLRLSGPEEYAEALREQLDRAVACRLRGVTNVGSHLSSGLDSSAITATAARLLAPAGGKVTAFTAIPDPQYHLGNGVEIADESTLAALTAGLYPNVEHVRVRDASRSPLDVLQRYFPLVDQPVFSLFNTGWGNSISDAARDRKLSVVLTGEYGNLGLSYNGMERLAELMRGGNWLHAVHEARLLAKTGSSTFRTALSRALGPWCPAPLWLWLNRRRGRKDYDRALASAVNPDLSRTLGLSERAKEKFLDLATRPWKDGFASRLWCLTVGDPGNYNKGVLAGWRIDQRHPAGDVRLLEFCLAVPMEQFLRQGERKALARRALADRLPQALLDDRRRRLQGADWLQRLRAGRADVSAELERLTACGPALRTLDVPRLMELAKRVPEEGPANDDVYADFRTVLTRGLSSGYFLRRVTGSNR